VPFGKFGASAPGLTLAVRLHAGRISRGSNACAEGASVLGTATNLRITVDCVDNDDAGTPDKTFKVVASVPVQGLQILTRRGERYASAGTGGCPSLLGLV
jgi:hypothetical protein